MGKFCSSVLYYSTPVQKKKNPFKPATAFRCPQNQATDFLHIPRALRKNNDFFSLGFLRSRSPLPKHFSELNAKSLVPCRVCRVSMFSCNTLEMHKHEECTIEDFQISDMHNFINNKCDQCHRKSQRQSLVAFPQLFFHLRFLKHWEFRLKIIIYFNAKPATAPKGTCL